MFHLNKHLRLDGEKYLRVTATTHKISIVPPIAPGRRWWEVLSWSHCVAVMTSRN